MKNVAVLGSTGSIGRMTLEVIGRHRDRLRVYGIAARRRVGRLREQALLHRPARVVVGDVGDCGGAWADGFPAGTALGCGLDALTDLARDTQVDIVVNAMTGIVGFEPTMEALRAGKRVGLANKEILVTFGALVMEEARASRGEIVPVDSEHSAIHQCLRCGTHQEVSRIILTASGGPFLKTPRAEFASISPEAALRHPVWSMGRKITIDSATLMNKGLEVIEACWLFDLDPEQIGVLVHPQSMMHSIVEFVDGSMVGQLAVPDMRLPIQYALLYPERTPSLVSPCDLVSVGQLRFEEPDLERFPCLALAYEALRAGGTRTAVLNAANDVAVAAFLAGRIRFEAIAEMIQEAMSRHENTLEPRYSDIVEADRWARELVEEAIRRRGPRPHDPG